MTRLIRWTLWERLRQMKSDARDAFGEFVVAALLAAGMLVLWWFIIGPDRMGR